ncbi:MAG: T9SS type A sorting domain-containing protein [Bacteroidales bacterium]|nr:T9SS type A sorting domain-containing protein [Bacteroidales bacterium]
MKTKFVFSLSFLIIFIVIIFTATAQQWAQPINISNSGYYDDHFPDICIDTNDVLHCVWTRKFSSTLRKIYYSKSSNHGENWTVPQNISNNYQNAMFRPKIVCGSDNILYLCYDCYDVAGQTEYIYFQQYDGNNWSVPVNITENYPSATNNVIAIDNNDRVYVFWAMPWDVKFYYRYLENGNWSDPICPYTNDYSSIFDVVVDNDNNLHCIGVHYLTSEINRKIYFKFDRTNEEWSEITEISNENTFVNQEDIALDAYENPHCVWGQEHGQGSPPPHATAYTFYNSINWSEPEIIVEDPGYQCIDIVENNIFIVDVEKQDDDDKVVFYRKDEFGEWYGEIVYTCNRVEPWKLFYDSKYLYILLSGKIDNEDILDIYITKTPLDSLTTNVSKIKSIVAEQLVLEQNYPNPLISNTKITFELNKGGNVMLMILNVQGYIVKKLLSRKLEQGTYIVEWDGTDINNNKLSSGYYYYRLIVDDQQKTRSLMLMNE